MAGQLKAVLASEGLRICCNVIAGLGVRGNWGFILLFSLLGGPSSFGQDSPIKPRWNDPGRCGTNCLFVFLGLVGDDTGLNYLELAQGVPVGRQGSSLLALSDAAKAQGVDVTVLRIKFDDLSLVKTPYVLHLDYTSAGGMGHFVTVLGCDLAEGETLLRVFDGGDLQIKNLREASVRSFFSGYILALGSPLARPRLVSWLSLLCQAALLFGGFSVGRLLASRLPNRPLAN